MRPEDRELLRENIIAQCCAAPSAGIPVTTIIQRVKQAGYDQVAIPEIIKEIRHVEDKGFIRAVVKALSPENQRFVGTSEGDDFLAVKGLA